jgi:CIC family chloride channel protein
MVLHLLLGDEPLFHVPAYHLVHPVEFVVYAVLGLVGGLVSVWFVKMLLWIRARFLTFPASTVWLQPAAGGLIVGLMGWFVPEVLGVGYGYVGEALNGHMAFKFMALLVALKVIATTSSYSSGNAGGIFGPSLFIGAMVGGAVGSLAHMVLPGYTADVGAYALVGMGTTFAGIVRVPLTSVIMIFEMTRDYSIIVPLMISNLVSFYISYTLQRTPIYEALAHQLGIHLPSQTTRQDIAHLRVSAAMRPPEGAESTVPPHSDDDFPHVHADHGLDVALHRMGSSGLKILPVVSRKDVTYVEGVVTLEDILRVYGLHEE